MGSFPALSLLPSFHIISARSGFPKRVATDNPYSENFGAIQAVIAYVCRKNHLRPEKAEDFTSWVNIQLLEDDCAILRRYRGESSFKTFLVVVIANKLHDFRDHSGPGKFRPSSVAVRLGKLAIELEKLVIRDEVPYDQAAQLLVSKGIATSIRQCDEIWSQLPSRGPRRFVSVDHIDHWTAPPSQDPLQKEEDEAFAERVVMMLHEAVGQLPPGDNLLFRLRYWDDISVANIAKTQALDQSATYRRYDQINRGLKKTLLSQGVSEEQFIDLLRRVGIDPDLFGNEGEK
jgi:RNA polymerase sigma factor (sigma-70 family)